MPHIGVKSPMYTQGLLIIYKYTETCNSKGTTMENYTQAIKICLPSERSVQELVWGRLCHRYLHDEICKNSINNLLLHDAIIYFLCVQVT